MQDGALFTERWQQDEKQSSVDGLTGLASHGKGEDWLRANLKNGAPAAVLLVDLDHFKQINARMGHRCGDQILRSIGQRLAESAEGFDIISRWEGAKFLMMMSQSSGMNLEEKANILRARLRRPYKISIDDDSLDVNIGVSVGVARATAGATLEQFLHCAEIDLSRTRELTR